MNIQIQKLNELTKSLRPFINHVDIGHDRGRGFVKCAYYYVHKPYLVEWSTKWEGLKKSKNLFTLFADDPILTWLFSHLF